MQGDRIAVGRSLSTDQLRFGKGGEAVLKRLLLRVSRTAAFSQFVSRLEQGRRDHSELLRVLTYHRVDYPAAHPELDPSLISATPDAFDQQMSYLAAHYCVISAMELLEALRRGGPFPTKAVMVTFDDAYGDFEQYAWPILKRYRHPVSLFIPTAFPGHSGSGFWWDRLYRALSTATQPNIPDPRGGRLPVGTRDEQESTFHLLKRLLKLLPHRSALEWVDRICGELDAPSPANPVLGWEALRRLAAEGVTMGAHTQTHPLLTRLSLEEMEAEVIGSRGDIARQVCTTPSVFAYPGGEFNPEVLRVLKHAGFCLAFTAKRGLNDLRKSDPLRLRRVNVGRRTSLNLFRVQLSPWARYLNYWNKIPA